MTDGYTLTLEVGISPSTQETSSDPGSAGAGGMGQPPAGAPGQAAPGSSTSSSSSGPSAGSSRESSLGSGAPQAGGSSSDSGWGTSESVLAGGGVLAAVAGWLGITRTRSQEPVTDSSTGATRLQPEDTER